MKKRGFFSDIGPGLVIAATGLGAGDIIAASVAGAKYGTALLWAALAGAVMKYVLNEGLARWQLATGTTLLEGWIQRLPRFFSAYFFVYLLVWTFIVAGALIAGSGLAAHALFPQISVATWGILHSLAAMVLVLTGRYRILEPVMKLFMALMMMTVLVCAIIVAPTPGQILAGMVPSLPNESLLFVFGVIGGVGGSVTVLCYGYWIRERNWSSKDDLARSRKDLAVAYSLTGLFGIAIMVISAGVSPEAITGPRMALGVANHLGTVTGPVGKLIFLIGFWCAIFSSMLGVWNGIPYLFADFIRQYRGYNTPTEPIDTRSTPYRGYLLYIAIPPMLLLLADKPVWLVIIYAVAGAFFMPLLGGVLLYLNNRKEWLGNLSNGLLTNIVLAITALVFVLLLVDKLSQYL